MTVTYGFEHEHLDAERAATYARTFGAERSYTDHQTMLRDETLDCVFVVTDVSSYPQLASDVLSAGVAVWTEKPPVSSLDDIATIRRAIEANGKQYAVGLKKAFAPANQKLCELSTSEEFGAVRSLSLRYAQLIPTVEELRAPSDMRSYFLDHLCHPLSVLRLLGGPVARMMYERAPNGSGIALFTTQSGAVASLHLPWAMSMRAIQERTEVNGDRASAWSENNTRVTYAPNPRLRDLAYGRDPDHTVDTHAVTVWEPEFSLGQLYNTGAFLLGYFGELQHFCDAVLAGTEVEIGGIDWAEEGIRIFDAFAEGPGMVVAIGGGAST